MKLQQTMIFGGFSCLTGIGNDYICILYESSQADLVFHKINIKDILK